MAKFFDYQKEFSAKYSKKAGAYLVNELCSCGHLRTEHDKYRAVLKDGIVVSLTDELKDVNHFYFLNREFLDQAPPKGLGSPLGLGACSLCECQQYSPSKLVWSNAKKEG